jgi:hypothetical protein
MTCGRSEVFSRYSGFLHLKKNWPPQYNWNIVESGVKHHKLNQNLHHGCGRHKNILIDHVHVGEKMTGILTIR